MYIYVRKAIVYSLGLRLKRICDSEDVYESRKKELEGFLWKTSYKRGFVEKQFCKVNCFDQDVLLNGTEREIQIGRIDWF